MRIKYTPVRYTFIGCTKRRYTTMTVHAYKASPCEVHAREVHRMIAMRYTLMRYTPLRCTPVRYTSVRHMPVKCTALRGECWIEAASKRGVSGKVDLGFLPRNDAQILWSGGGPHPFSEQISQTPQLSFENT